VGEGWGEGKWVRENWVVWAGTIYQLDLFYYDDNINIYEKS